MFLIIMTLYVSYIIFLICCRHFKIVQSNNAYNHLFCHLSLDHFLIHIKLFSSYFYIKKKVFLFLISNMQVTSVLKWSQRFVFTSGRCCRNCWKLFLLTKSCCRTDWSICFKYIKGKKKKNTSKGQLITKTPCLQGTSSVVIPANLQNISKYIQEKFFF